MDNLLCILARREQLPALITPDLQHSFMVPYETLTVADADVSGAVCLPILIDPSFVSKVKSALLLSRPVWFPTLALEYFVQTLYAKVSSGLFC